MSSSNKKLSIEERLSLAARAKSKKKGKKLESPSLSSPHSSTTEKTPEVTSEVEGTRDAAENCSTREETPENEGFASLLPPGYQDLSAQALLDILRPHLIQASTRPSASPRPEQTDSSLVKLIKQKDTLIDELRQEGENLSKTELKLNNTIKELRDKSKSKDKELCSVKELLSAKDSEQGSLQLKVNECVTRCKDLEHDLGIASKERDEILAKYRSLQSEELQSLREELASTQETNGHLKTQVQRLRDQIETDAMKASMKYSTLSETSENEITRLETTLEELRIKIRQYSPDNVENGNDDKAREQLKLKSHCKNLENELKTSKENWSSIESSLRQRMYELEQNLQSEQVALKASNDRLMIVRKQNEFLQSQIKSNEAYESSSKAEIKNLTDKVQTLELHLRNTEDDLGLWKEKYQVQRRELEAILGNSGHQANVKSPASGIDEKETERDGEDQLDIMSRWEMQDLQDTGRSFQGDDDVADLEKLEDLPSDEIADIPDSTMKGSASSFDLTPSQEQGTSAKDQQNTRMNAQMVGRLGGQVRRLETELASLHDSNTRLLKDKQDVNDTIVRLMEENDKATAVQKQLEAASQRAESLEEKLNTALQLLGERSERVEELENDVNDLKELLQMQVQQMVELQENAR